MTINNGIRDLTFTGGRQMAPMTFVPPVHAAVIHS